MSTNGAFSYCASKALAEKAAWDWMDEQKPSFTLSTINPPWVFGPSVSGSSLDHLNESLQAIWKLINGSTKEVPPTDFAGFADVRDVAKAHRLAYETKEAGGQRFLPGNHFDYQTAADIIREEFPELRNRVPEGVKGAGLKEEVYVPDGSKAEKILGLKYTSLKNTMVDTVKDLL